MIKTAIQDSNSVAGPEESNKARQIGGGEMEKEREKVRWIS